MINGPTILIITFFIASFLLWKTGLGERFFTYLGWKAERGTRWLTSGAGVWVRLVDYLPYRDFIEGDWVVDTKDGWLWGGLYIEVVPSDGFSGAQWNNAYAQLNRIFTGLPDETWVQTITYLDNNVSKGVAVYERLEKGRVGAVLQTILKARAAHLKQQSKAGLICNSRTFVFVGRRKKMVTQKVPGRGLISLSSYVDLEEEDFRQLRDETLRARDYFSAALRSAGGRAQPLTSEQIFALIYEDLNEERASIHPVPRLDIPSPTGGLTYQTPVIKIEESTRSAAVEERAEDDIESQGDQLSHLLDELTSEGVIDAPIEERLKGSAHPTPGVPHAALPFQAEDEVRRMWITAAGLFAESPRERLAFEPIEVYRDYFRVGERLVMAISLQQLPTLVFAGLCEALTRHPEMCFPVKVATSFEIGDRYDWDNRLAKKCSRLQLNLERSRRPDMDEEMSVEDIMRLRADVKSSEAKIGELGMGVVFSAPDLNELYRRRDIVLMAMRAMEGLEGTIEKHMPLPQLAATLPCAPHDDGRRRACLSRDAVAMMPLTGGGGGPVREDQAIMVFMGVDGHLVHWHPKPKHFPSGMEIVCGAAGSGKSGLLNFKRTAMSSAGYRLITIDLGGSSYRVCAALNGTYIELTDARRSYKFGLFDIRPRRGESYSAEALTAEGLPRDRLAEVENLLEVLCVDPRNPQLTMLSMREAGFLHKKIAETYERMGGEVPRLDDFIDTLKIYALKDERELAEELSARLSIYASDSSMGRFLNESPDAEEISTDSPYTVFDLRHAIDNPRLMLVASLAVNAFVRRMLQVDRRVPKYIDVDEFHVVAKNPLICNMINTTMRTARKLNMIGCVASQSPSDFEFNEANPAAAGIRDNAEVFWLLQTSNVNKAKEVFQLKPGVARLVDELQTQASDAWRDCVLLWPGGGCAHLRLRFGPLDQRLLLGAAAEDVVGLPEAMSAAMNVSPHGQVPPALSQALREDALGARTSGAALARATA